MEELKLKPQLQNFRAWLWASSTVSTLQKKKKWFIRALMQADHLSSCGWPMLSSFLPVCHMVYWNSIILNCGLLVLNVAWRAIYIWVSIWEYACSYCSVQPLFVYMCLFKFFMVSDDWIGQWKARNMDCYFSWSHWSSYPVANPLLKRSAMISEFVSGAFLHLLLSFVGVIDCLSS